MVTILAGSNKFEVNLKTYETIGDMSNQDEYKLVLYAELIKNGPVVELHFPMPPDKIISAINDLGIGAITNSVIDFNKNSVTLRRMGGENIGSKNFSRPKTNDERGSFVG
jgi:hypothetical protein